MSAADTLLLCREDVAGIPNFENKADARLIDKHDEYSDKAEEKSVYLSESLCSHPRSNRC